MSSKIKLRSFFYIILLNIFSLSISSTPVGKQSINDSRTKEYKFVSRSQFPAKKEAHALKNKILFCRGKPTTKEQPSTTDQQQRVPVKKEEEPSFIFVFSGYIKPEFFVDSRQVFGCRANQTLFNPECRLYDRCCRDINAHGQFNILAIESRVRTEIIGPSIGSAKSKGVIEADFYGVREDMINSLRMRHAYFSLTWKNRELLLGQYWHPITSPECYPQTLSFNCGGPMDPYKRVPQIRITRFIRPLELIAAVSSAVHFVNNGPIGFSSSYLRNAIVPNLSFLIQARPSTHLIGAGIDFKRLVPRLVSNNNFKVSESINSLTALAYTAFNWETFALRAKIALAQNGSVFTLLGGYAVHSIQPDTDHRTYTNLNTITAWIDFNRVHKKVEPGCLIGYTKNLGATSTIIPCLQQNDSCESLVYTFLYPNIDYVFRISPRIRIYYKPVVFGAELEYTRAAFGQLNNRGRINCPRPVENIRLLLAAFYFF
ncbi:hypothetical protein E3J79_03895 [Candidatus Dependentiae bacterium]|nr:MAG: hypothetical protein E3J79_03895 [Candidatus Dependentiae bacterium]